MSHIWSAIRRIAGGLFTLGIIAAAEAQTVAPFYSGTYSIADLGQAPSVPISYGGIEFKSDDNDILLLGGSANNFAAKIYAVGLRRGAGGHVTGFTCAAVEVASASGSVSTGIDGGLDYGPDDVLFYATYSSNEVGQIKPGSTAADRFIHMTPLGVASSLGTLQFVPAGYPGAGRLKLASYNAWIWYDATVSPDGNGTFDITLSGTTVPLTGGPEGIAFVPLGAPLFPNPSVLVSEYSNGRVSSYEIDSNGDPIVATRKDFITGLSGAEGATIDPVTGDFLFSTFGGGSRVIAVRGFDAVDNVPRLTGAVSRRLHGGAGVQDVLVSLESPAIEPRRNGSQPQMVIGFDIPVEVTDGSVDCGDEVVVTNGSCTSAVLTNPLTLTVDMVYDKNACVGVEVSGFRGLGGGQDLGGDRHVQVITHEGNANAVGGVNILDMQAIKNRLTQAVSDCAGTAVLDIDANGTINILDMQAVKNNLFIPAGCNAN